VGKSPQNIRGYTDIFHSATDGCVCVRASLRMNAFCYFNNVTKIIYKLERRAYGHRPVTGFEAMQTEKRQS